MAPTQLEIEQSVRDQLYGDRGEVAAKPLSRPAPVVETGPLGRSMGARYRLLQVIGAGGMATVYRARDERLKRDVAVKVIADRLADIPSAVRRFRREAELCARMEHPNVVAILDAGVEPQEFIVTVFVDGLDGGRLLQSDGRLMPAQTVHIVAQVCQALEHAHDRHVFHNDVSPRNIVIGQRDATATLVDFGIASDAREVRPTRPKHLLGTPGYVPPEILKGGRPSPRSDLYALAVVAHRFLAGPTAPRDSATGDTAPLATASPRLQPLAELRPRLPRRLSEAIDQALAIDPDARQQSVAEFRAHLVGGRTARPLELPRAA
jgi:serine/threonine protein kinase